MDVIRYDLHYYDPIDGLRLLVAELSVAIGIIFALVSFFGWGVSDLLSKVVIEKLGYYRTVFFYNFTSAIPLLLFALVFVQIPPISFKIVLITALIGFLNTMVGCLMFYKGLEKGDVSVLSPISSSWGVVTVLLALIFLDEMLTLRQSYSIVLIFSGIILSSLSWSGLKLARRKKLVSGAKEVIASTIFWGVALFLLKFVVDDLGSVWSLVIMRYFGVTFLFLYGKATRQGFNFSERLACILVITIGLLDVIGFLGFNLGVTTELVSIVTPIVTSYPAVTFMLAHIFLHERLEKNQYIGIGMILSGLVLISVI